MSDNNDRPEHEGNQPCFDFNSGKHGLSNMPESGWQHQCPKCGKGLSFCINCMSDHHEDGWDKCQPIHCDLCQVPITREELIPFRAGDECLYICQDCADERGVE